MSEDRSDGGIMVLLCSPHRNGNSDALARAFLEGAGGGRVLKADEIHAAGCASCRACDATGRCVIDDGAAAFYEGALAARVLVVASPIHFGTLPSACVALLERAQFIWTRRRKSGRAPPVRTAGGARRWGVALLSGGQRRRRFFRGALDSLRFWFETLGARPAAALVATGLHDHDDAAGRPDLLARARRLGAAFRYPLPNHRDTNSTSS